MYISTPSIFCCTPRSNDLSNKTRHKHCMPDYDIYNSKSTQNIRMSRIGPINHENNYADQ
jgi:hypothetical protein